MYIHIYTCTHTYIHTQWILEKDFELCRPTFTWIFFTKHVLWYIICGWLFLGSWTTDMEGRCNVICIFLTVQRVSTHNPWAVQGLTVRLYVYVCLYMCIYICTHQYHILLIHSSINGHLNCFQKKILFSFYGCTCSIVNLATVNNATVNTGVEIPVQILAVLVYTQKYNC